MSSSANDHRVYLQEVGPRDGLQSVSKTLSPEIRGQLIDLLSAAGLTRIQIGSFVNSKLVPQMADTDLVWRRIRKVGGVRFSALVLSVRGAEKAIKAGIPNIEVYVSASETHSRRNVGTDIKTALSNVLEIIDLCSASKITVTAGIMCAFGCFYEGAVPVGAVSKLIDAFPLDKIAEFALADTAGTGKPTGIVEVLSQISGAAPLEMLSLHLHDTNGMGYENLTTALDFGVRKFDSSIGGLGGCPFIPGAKGNISTERVVRLIEERGFDTGVDLNRLLKAEDFSKTALRD
jgi:hydroxymethylglutaryl-CoA lyase